MDQDDPVSPHAEEPCLKAYSGTLEVQQLGAFPCTLISRLMTKSLNYLCHCPLTPTPQILQRFRNILNLKIIWTPSRLVLDLGHKIDSTTRAPKLLGFNELGLGT